MLKQDTVLESMKKSFPSWSDIRKRTKKSVGGQLLTAYSNEFEKIQQAIDEYQKLFFLVSYDKKESKVIDYLYLSFIGENKDFKMVEPACSVTIYPDEFYDNVSTTCLYQGGCVLLHEKLLGNRKTIKYSVDGYEYESKCYYEHIWNVFDEFALFAGLERQPGEKNAELAKRTYDVFKNFQNASSSGLKNTVINTLKNDMYLDHEDIDIIPIDKNLNMDDPQMKEIYEDFLQYNKDVFRAKIWNTSLWENKFQKTDFIPHRWDVEMPITQDGVGSNDSLKIDYIKNLNQNDATNVRVDAYKKDFETIRQYIGRSNLEASLMLTLTKYSDNIKPKEMRVKIHAYDALKLKDPSSIRIQGMQHCSGESLFYVEDLATKLYNVTKIENGKLDKSTKYMLRFTPKSSFSDMSIGKCLLKQGSTEKDLRKAKDNFKMQGGALRNTKVLAHVDTISELSYRDNIISGGKGFTVGSDNNEGTFGFDVTGMSGQMVNCNVTCRPVDITDSKYVTAKGGFALDKDRMGYTDTKSDSLGYVEIGTDPEYKMTCNAYSFELAASSDPEKQGSIEVTIVANGKTTTTIYEKPCEINGTFESNTETSIVIRKYGLYPVQVRNIRIASYDIEMKLSDGRSVEKIGSIMRLPKNVDGQTLKVRLVPYTSSYPVVNYVHVGLSLTGARYEVEFTTTSGDNPILDIDTDCDVSLYKVSGSTKTLVGTEKSYCTKASYKNTTSKQGQIIIDTSDFTSIVGSSPKIFSKFKGTAQDYIVLEPGESITSMTINGELARLLSSRSLSEVLTNNAAYKEYYVTSEVSNAVFIRDTATGASQRVTIKPQDVEPMADTFKVVGLPDNVSVKYVSKAGDSKISNGLNEEPFDYFCLVSDASVDHIAYNKVFMLTELKTNIKVVNNFSPLISGTAMMVYEIELPKNTKDHLEFGTSKDFWSLGVDPLGYSILTTLETKNAETWVLEINHVSSKHILSNEIPLEERYLIDGAYHDLAEYMIDPEKGLKINSRADKEVETFTVKNVNKLHYSNTKNVQLYSGSTKITSGFTIMEDEGLVIWDEDTSYIGKEVQAKYTVNVPASITYNEDFADRLYGLVSFKTEAYKHIGSKEFQNLVDKDTKELGMGDNADRLVTKCSNPCFQAVTGNGKLSVSQTREENKLAVHNGYIYDAGQEFWFFNDRYDDAMDRFKNVELHDVTRLADKWLFHMASKNYLPYSTMRTSVMSKLCAIDFTERLPVPISEFYHLTACDSYNLWYFVDMQGSLVKSHNDYGINFKTTDKTGYAVAEITRFMKKGNIISLFVSGSIKVQLVKETLASGLPFAKSVFVDAKNVISMKQKGSFWYYVINKEPDENVRYYLYVSGTSGQIDDMISMPYKNIQSMIDSHKKNIDWLGYEIEETLPKDYEYNIEFERAGCKYYDLQCDSRTWEISTSSTIEYGLTLIDSAEIDRCYLLGATKKKGKITLATEDASVRTRGFYVRNRTSVYELAIKINDIAVDKYRDFTISAYGSQSQNGTYMLVAQESKTNMLIIPEERVCNYMYIEVTGKKNKVIYSIETYARYAERGGEAKLVPIQKTSGELISKLYNLKTSANYRFDGVDADVTGDASKVQYYIRGAKENSASIVFTDWKKFNPKATISSVVLKGYAMFQFKVALTSSDVTVKVKNFKLTVV